MPTTFDSFVSDELRPKLRAHFVELMEAEAVTLQKIQAELMINAVRGGYKVGIYELFVTHTLAAMKCGLSHECQVYLLRGLIAGWAHHKKFGDPNE